MKFIFLSLFFIFFLSACSEEVSLEQACDELSGLCAELKVDSRCIRIRRDVIMTEYWIRKERTLDRFYEQLLNLEKFTLCSEQSTWIEYINPANKYSYLMKNEIVRAKIAEYRARLIRKRQDRKSTHDKALEMLNRYIERTAISSRPHLLYWHWTRLGSEEAVQKLIEIDNQNGLNKYDLQFFIAHEYGRYDSRKAEKAFLTSLELYPPDQYKNKKFFESGGSNSDGKYYIDIFQSLSSMYYTEGDFNKAYIFGKLLDLRGNKSVNLKMLTSRIRQEDIANLNVAANEIHDSLAKGVFSRALI